MTEPRLPPLPESEWDETVRELLEPTMPMGGGRPLNIFTTLARHPKLLKRWLLFGNALLFRGDLSARDRELAILRCGWLCRSEYEWGQHVLIARDAGLTDAEIEGVARREPEGWTELEMALFAAVDELHVHQRIGDDTWATLAAHYSDRQLIELCMLVGQYHLVAMTLNSLGVERDPGVPGFPDGG